jgi:ubiquinone/menaquinone biosynthesis C-methylase UbiE
MADTSAGMRSVIEGKVASGAIPDGRVWALDLTTHPVPDERFDLVVTVMTLHHIPELDRVLDAFAAVLDDGGHLCIVDLEHEDGSFHGADFGGHHGFVPAELASSLARAGFVDVTIRPCHEMVRDGRAYPLFLATGRTSARRPLADESP